MTSAARQLPSAPSVLGASSRDVLDRTLTSLGLAMILVGQPIAWWARGALFDSESAVFPAAIVLVGLALMVRLRPFADPRMHVQPWLIAVYAFGYLIPVGFLSLVDVDDLGPDAAYAIFTAIVLLALSLVPLKALQGLLPALLVVGGLSSALPLLELATGNVVESFTRLALKGNNNPLVLGMVGGTTVLASVMFLHTSRRPSILLGLACGAGVVVGAASLMLSNTRSVMLALLIVIPAFYMVVLPRIHRSRGQHSRGVPLLAFLSVLAASAAAAPAAAVLLLGPDLVMQVSSAAVERATGALAAIGEGGGSVDRSSQERIDVFARTLDGLTPAGHGISAQVRAQGDVTGVGIYPHFTYLQAFYDFGMLGAIWFALLHLVIPLTLILKRFAAGPLDPATAFVILYYVFSHMDHLTHATPYSWLALMPVALVYAVVPRMPFYPRT